MTNRHGGNAEGHVLLPWELLFRDDLVTSSKSCLVKTSLLGLLQVLGVNGMDVPTIFPQTMRERMKQRNT